MSVIIAVQKAGRIVVSADTLAFYGSRREHRDNLSDSSKVRRFGGSYIGIAGYNAYDNVLAHYFKSLKRIPTLKDQLSIYECFLKIWKAMRERYQLVADRPDSDDKSPLADLDSEFIVVNKHGIFQVDGDLTVLRFEKYLAIGSGQKYAYGALHALYDTKHTALQIATRAAAAAAHFDQYCGGEIESFEI